MCKGKNGPMCTRLYALIVLLIAAISSLLLFTLKVDQLDSVILFIKFFESMLPILAAGALLKYLWKSKKGCCGCCSGKCNCCSGNGKN